MIDMTLFSKKALSMDIFPYKMTFKKSFTAERTFTRLNITTKGRT